MSDEANQKMDPVFGQVRAFALDDPLVDPSLLNYLNSVKNEAIRSTFDDYANSQSSKQTLKHIASMYDDDETYSRPSSVASAMKDGEIKNHDTLRSYKNKRPELLLAFQRNMDNWVRWISNSKDMLYKEGYVFQGYDDHTVDIILYHLREYLSETKEQKGFVLHLSNILKDAPFVVKENDDMAIDKEWIDMLFTNLKSKQLKGIDDVRKFISEKHEYTPMGFKQWYSFITKNEPSHSIFATIINNRNIWILIQYMNKDWLKVIHMNKKPTEAYRLSQWMLYILLHLPDHLTAEYISELRTLGKKCQEFILMKIESKNDTYIKSFPYTQELEALGISKSCPGSPTILELTLSVVSVIYGQKDLTDWENIP